MDSQRQPFQINSNNDMFKTTRQHDFVKQKSNDKKQSMFSSYNQNTSFKDQNSPIQISKINNNYSPNSNVEQQQQQSDYIYSQQQTPSLFKKQYSQHQQANDKQGNLSPLSSYQNIQQKTIFRSMNPFQNSINTQIETIYLDEEKNSENKQNSQHKIQEQQSNNTNNHQIIFNEQKIEMEDKKQDCSLPQTNRQIEQINQQSQQNNNTVTLKVEEPGNTQNCTDKSLKSNQKNFHGISPQILKKQQEIKNASDQFQKLNYIGNTQKDKYIIQMPNQDVRRETIQSTQTENFMNEQTSNIGISQDINQDDNKNKGQVNRKDSTVFLNAYRTQMRKDYLKKHVDQILVKHKKLKISCSYFIYRISCGKFFKSKENLMIRQSRRLLNKDIDIISILNKIKEIEKIKHILFNHDQMTLFNYFPKPLLCLDQNENINLKTQLCRLKKKQVKKLKIDPKYVNVVNKVKTKFKNISKKQEDEIIQKKLSRLTISLNRHQDQMHEIEELYAAYENLTQLKQKHRIDDVLINMLENNMKQVFQNSYQQGFGIDKLQKLICQRQITKKITSHFKKYEENKKQEEVKQYKEDKIYEVTKDQVTTQKIQFESQQQGLILFEQNSSSYDDE